MTASERKRIVIIGAGNAGKEIASEIRRKPVLGEIVCFLDDDIKKIGTVESGIPVLGHLGFTPQLLNTIGGYKIQGKSYETAEKILESAKKLEKAGAFAIVLELMPADSAQYITQNLSIPTIGIGAGAGCNGQIVVIDDILGKFTDFTPKFVKKYANLHDTIMESVQKYSSEVKEGIFPSKEQSFELKEEEREKFNAG